MFIGVFLAFIGGWVIWFWIDKPPAAQFGLPPPGDSTVENFQRSFDLLKAGHPDLAYLYIWHAHYLILSVVFGILLAATFRTIADHLASRSRRRHYFPSRAAEPPPVNVPHERTQAPPDADKTPVAGGADDHPSR
jgi:hypothetical protein